MIYDNVLQLVGNTPIVRLNRIPTRDDAEVVVKLESLNPGGSVKDRIGIRIIEDAERSGRLKPGGAVVEATSGNTGAGLALVCIQRGYRSIFVMPDKVSQEKIRYLRALNATVVTCPTAVEPEDPRSYYCVSRRLAEETPGAVLANQYHNPVNPQTHYEWTGPEIWEQTEGKLDFFVAGMGTGGTISGIGRYLKEKNPKIRIVGVDIEGSILHHYFCTGEMSEAHTYLIEGIGEDFIPSTTDMKVVDEIVTVGDRESFVMARRLSREEGIFVGGSCGSAVAGAMRIASREGRGKRVLVLLPDHGNRYLSTFHGDEWMMERGLLEPTEVTVGDVLRRKPPGPDQLVLVGADDSVRAALMRMREQGVSQVPVMEAGRVVGSLEDSPAMARVLADTALLDLPVRGIMGEPFPTVRRESPMSEALAPLAARKAAVLVMDNGDIAGLLTRLDFLKFIRA